MIINKKFTTSNPKVLGLYLLVSVYPAHLQEDSCTHPESIAK